MKYGSGPKKGIAILIANKVMGKKKEEKPEGPSEEGEGDEGLLYLDAFTNAKDPAEKLAAMEDLHRYMHSKMEE